MQFFSKRAKKVQKRAKYLKIWAKMYKIWKYFKKGQPHACDYCTHERARICTVKVHNCSTGSYKNFWKIEYTVAGKYSSYLLKDKNINTWKSCEICLKLTIKTPKRRHWRRSGVFIIFEHNLHFFLVFHWLWKREC